MLFVRERAPQASQPAPYETDLARRWYGLPVPLDLPLSDGARCRLLHAGRPGGPQGPDIRDAVLALPSGEHTTGDVEFHIRCSDWYTHGHHTDPRYNNVILHVVLIYDSPEPVVRHDGQTIPVCSLNDVAPHASMSPGVIYPCERIVPAMTPENRAALLRQAGLERFEQRTEQFLKLLRDAQPQEPFNARDTCLIPALAEALGYGRDRAFFRAAGLRLVGLLNDTDLPEPQGHSLYPSPLDVLRLQALGKLVKQWRVDGAWETIGRIFDAISVGAGVERMGGGDACVARAPVEGAESSDERATAGDASVPSTHPLHPRPYGKIVVALRELYPGIGTARADIVICNVVLPFAAAVASMEGDYARYALVRHTYLDYPALASNQVTRAMSRQLRLPHEPQWACQQQGLHHLYAQACKEKRCEVCPVTHWGLV